MSAFAVLSGVRKSYREVRALDGVDLRIDPGEVVALLGPNGAGKSTAIRVLLGLRRPDVGEARLFGEDPRRASARRRCGATPQETDLPETLRVREIVDLVRAHFPRPLATETVLERFGLDELAQRQAGGLSGGQRRRVAVALAFAGDPELVFLDEPSAGLDADARGRLWRALGSFAARGRGILLTTHDFVEAEALASRVVVLDRGKVVLAGTVGEIAARTGLHEIRIRAQPLPTLPDVERRVEHGRHVILLARRPGPVIEALVEARADLEEIEIAPVRLEQALALERPR